uniref:VOC domain-containing protein n=1 Tax=Pan paniscus TaxID=9597 RepID=A0A2R9C361_PANPA
MAARRALHFVFKVGNRFQTARFYRDVLGMKALRGVQLQERGESPLGIIGLGEGLNTISPRGVPTHVLSFKPLVNVY